jgi:hypothetical protein
MVLASGVAVKVVDYGKVIKFVCIHFLFVLFLKMEQGLRFLY